MQKLLICRPNIGDYVFGQKEDETWVRGYVLCVIPQVQLASIEDTKLETVDNIATIEDPLTDMYAFTGVCELADVTERFLVRSIVSNMLLNIMYVTS